MSDTGSRSPVKQATDSGTSTPAPAAPKFTDKEEAVLKLAWQCLKSGPPDIDIVKLTEVGKFNTQKTASNTWGGIKKKLGLVNAGNVSATTADGNATPKAKATPKKRAKKTADDDDEEGATASPAKKPRATPKKAAAKVKAEEDGEGDE